MSQPLIVDGGLARRVEEATAKSNAHMVEARHRLSPQVNAEWRQFGSLFAVYDGLASPLTQTFGLGVDDGDIAYQLSEAESFFDHKQAPVFHEVCPLISAAHMAELSSRHYRPIELSNVLYQKLDSVPSQRWAPGIQLRVLERTEADAWAQVSADGWGEYPEYRDFLLDLGKVIVETTSSVSFWVEEAGTPIATGSLFILDGVGILGGASTIPNARRKGAQQLLLRERLQFAKDHGCDLATMSAVPGSPSQRNAQRNGFHIAYTRTKWMRDRVQ